jgi:hypothetical protein
MAARSIRRLWRPVAVGCCLIWAVTSLGGATGHVGASARDLGPSVRVLQLNLCDSGIAGCYTGRAVAEAAAVIRADAPDLVTLNEICRDDVSVLERAVSDANSARAVTSAFKAAVDRRSGQSFRCTNGEPYGIGIVALLPAALRGARHYGGVYPTLVTRDPEERVWLCLHAAYYACTTHLASTSTAVAFAQCRYLFTNAIPALRAKGAPDPMVLGADLNLRSGGSPDAQSCIPSDYPRVDDGRVQHIVATPDLAVRSSRSIDLQGTTDHPGLLVDLTIRQPPL